MGSQATETADPADAKFGTFGGVFTPSLLTILGVIMFLRFSTVVGHAGLWATLAILLAAKSITVVTSLSISSIATNMKVKGGGAYFLISRSLGVEFGGVIAVFFYVAQAVAVTLYAVGFSEAFLSAFPGNGLSLRMVATLTNLVVFVCVYIGAGWTIRVQYGILAVLLASIASIAAGALAQASPELLAENLAARWTDDISFFTMFALFFPAATGIMAGVNMSGDLRNPGRSIPWGTFAAIGVSGLIYAALALLLAASSARAELLGEGFLVKDKAWSGALVYAGVFCATLSSALGSMMGAPRILQAFARDNVFRRLRFFGQGSGKLGEPRRAVVLTFLIAQAGVLAGDLNTIAPMITMFFLMTYGTVNLACFYESLSRNPSFRPTFRLNHWSIALFGALGCMAIMFLIAPLWASVALLLAGGLYTAIARAEILVQWGDVDSGLAYHRARKALLRLERERYHPKNWRPTILALSGGAWTRPHLAHYARWLSAGYGIVSIGQLIRGDLEKLLDRRREAESLLRKFIREEELDAFPVVVVEENIREAIETLLQSHGIGGVRPNTVLLGWSEDPEKTGIFSETLRLAKRMQRSLIVIGCDEAAPAGEVPPGTINIWWSSPGNGPLMLLLAFLLKRNRPWRSHPLRIIRSVAPKADIANVTAEMKQMLADARIEADLVIVPTVEPLAAVRQAMGPSALLLAGFEPPDDDSACNLTAWLQEIIDLPGDVILVYNAGDVSLFA